MEAVEGIITSNLTGWGAFTMIIVLVVLGLLRGWLIPKSTHERELGQERRRGDEALETARELRTQNAELLRSFKIVRDFFKKVPVDAVPEGDDR